MIFDSHIPDYAIVDSYVKLSRKIIGNYVTGFVNAILRKISKSDNYVLKKESQFNLGVALSYPDWIIESWINQYGENKTIKLCEYFNKTYTLMIRRNELIIDHNLLVDKI